MDWSISFHFSHVVCFNCVFLACGIMEPVNLQYNVGVRKHISYCFIRLVSVQDLAELLPFDINPLHLAPGRTYTYITNAKWQWRRWNSKLVLMKIWIHVVTCNWSSVSTLCFLSQDKAGDIFQTSSERTVSSGAVMILCESRESY